MVDRSRSSSYEQKKVEEYMAFKAIEWLGSSIERNVKVTLSDGVIIEPDLYSEKDKIICEIYAHIGKLKGGQPRKISQDILKMLLLEKMKGSTYRKILIVADDHVQQYMTGKSYIAESIRQFQIEIKKIDLPKELHGLIMGAQKRQMMVNASDDDIPVMIHK